MGDSGGRPQRFGRYEVEALIGAGAMGRVYRAVDPAVGRPVAVKTIRPEQLERPEAAALLRRIHREARAAGALSHPGIVSVFDVGEDFLVMELVEGVDLATHLARNGPLDIPAAIALFTQIAEALDVAHANGVIHRDLKPSNVMLQADGRPKLMDFGVARLESGTLTGANEILGSPSYMAPEQIAGEAIDGRADLFSLAVVIYESLTGCRPFQGESITTIIYRVMNEPAPSPRTWRRELPEALDAVFDTALAKAPESRFRSARDLVAAVARAGKCPVASRPGPPPAVPDAAKDTAVTVDAAELLAPPGGESPSAETLTLATPPARGRLGGAAAPAILFGAIAIAAVLVLWPEGSPEESPREPASEANRLMVETRPAGAAVEIDGERRGETPIVAEVGPGSHLLRVSLDGYAPTTLRLDVHEGEPPKPLFFELVPVVARLEVTSDPAGADVFVETEKVGATPYRGSVPPGRVDILVNLPGVGAWRRTVDVEAGQTLELDAALQARSPVRPGADGIWEVGAGVTAPRRIAGAPAGYPDAAERADLEGTVSVEMIVTEEGRPTELEVVESAGPILDRAVLQAVEGWRFEPARRHGEPVRVRWRIRQHFRIAR